MSDDESKKLREEISLAVKAVASEVFPDKEIAVIVVVLSACQITVSK